MLLFIKRWLLLNKPIEKRDIDKTLLRLHLLNATPKKEGVFKWLK